jgi:hypothetical protein
MARVELGFPSPDSYAIGAELGLINSGAREAGTNDTYDRRESNAKIDRNLSRPQIRLMPYSQKCAPLDRFTYKLAAGGRYGLNIATSCICRKGKPALSDAH